EGTKDKYTATNILSVDFPLDRKLLDAFYDQFQSLNFKDIDINFSSELSEELERQARLTLVKNAIDDAKRNAENIANALNLKLINVKEVSKFGSERVFDQKDYKRMEPLAKAAIMEGYAAGSSSAFGSFEVEEKDITEEIVIVFEIGKK